MTPSHERELGEIGAHLKNIFRQLGEMDKEISGLTLDSRKRIELLQVDVMSLRSEVQAGFKQTVVSRWQQNPMVVAAASSTGTGAIILGVLKVLEMLVQSS